MYQRILILIGTFFVLSPHLVAQFTGTEDLVTSCDCQDPIGYLNYTVQLPDKYREYDLIQFVLYKDGYLMSTRTFKPKELNGGNVTLNILNAENKGIRNVFGKEIGRYHGNDFIQASYNSLCEETKTVQIEVASFGIKQIGTKVTYELDATKTKITAKATKIFDGGVELYRSEKLPFKPYSDYAKKLQTKESTDIIAQILVLASSIVFVTSF